LTISICFPTSIGPGILRSERNVKNITDGAAGPVLLGIEIPAGHAFHPTRVPARHLIVGLVSGISVETNEHEPSRAIATGSFVVRFEAPLADARNDNAVAELEQRFTVAGHQMPLTAA
jgi:hypothetical protein